ncbi:hypothetical protein HMPREF2531_02783 [Bacteroides intestinalis]|uniref:Uncharacterized protein n=1 Tax=Bacteroides intestinalis TaxID=329854 RepID=A0A139LAQ6_9BACE|nr:hypothetical protein HMPREF2531_02783 [Bacteroides intestinalis]
MKCFCCHLYIYNLAIYNLQFSHSNFLPPTHTCRTANCTL